MSDQPVYSGRTPPPLRTRVVVNWSGRELVCTRLVNPRTKKIAYATLVDGEMKWLPPKRTRPRDQWTNEPTTWRPLEPERWNHPLPEPVDRARPAVPEPVPANAGGLQSDTATWWLDPLQITYAAPGDPISLHEAEGRVMRAVAMCAPAEGRTLHAITAGDVLADLATAAAEALGDDDGPPVGYAPPFEPVGADHDDFLVAMRWFAALNPVELRHGRSKAWSLNQRQRVLVWRAQTRPYSWAHIARHINRSEARVRQLYDDAIEKCWRAANGLKLWREFTPKDVMAELRKGNRDYRSRVAPAVAQPDPPRGRRTAPGRFAPGQPGNRRTIVDMDEGRK